MRRVGRSVLVCGLFTVESSHWLPAQGGYAGPILAGVSNQGQNKREPYVTAGGRTYLIGTQDGNFPNGAPGARVLFEWQAGFRRCLRHSDERAEESRVGGSMNGVPVTVRPRRRIHDARETLGVRLRGSEGSRGRYSWPDLATVSHTRSLASLRFARDDSRVVPRLVVKRSR